MTRPGPGGWRGKSPMSWGEGSTGEGTSGEMTSTPHTGTWAGRCCCIQGLDAKSLGWTPLWIWLSTSLWGWCEFFTTFCLKICTSGPHICDFSLPQNREIIGQWPASKRHEPPGGIWNLPGPGLLSAASKGKASSGSSGNEGLEFWQKRGKRSRLGISFPSQGLWPST